MGVTDAARSKMSENNEYITIILPINTVKYWAEKSWYPASNNDSVEDQDVIKACAKALNYDLK